jgi:serine protease Do
MIFTRAKVPNCATLTMLTAGSIAILGYASFSKYQAQDKGPTGPSRATELQNRIRAVTSKILPFVVGLPGGTGVIISADGLVLSQAHVTPGHPSMLNASLGKQKRDRSAETTAVYLPDGSEVVADVLGWDMVYDLSVIKLRKPGPYPHAELSKHLPDLGSWVVRLGYPGPLRYRKGRPPELRLGKILHCSELTFVTDCLINGGDSGGPYFDLNGGVVGMIGGNRPTDSLLTNTSGFATPAKLIRTRLEAMARGEIIRQTAAEVRKLEAAKAVQAADMLPDDLWCQGSGTRELFREAVKPAAPAVVEILDGDVRTAYGTVVDRDGLLLTKASEVPDAPNCRLADGRVLSAQVVAFDPAYDLALLRVSASHLKPAAWKETADAPVGDLIAAVGTGALPVKIGVVSLPMQTFSGPFVTDVSRPPIVKVMPPEILGSRVQGRGYWVEFVEGNAANAGIRRGDVVVSITGMPIRSHEDVLNCVRGRRGGDRVPVQLVRAGKTIDLTMVLRTDPKTIMVDTLSRQSMMPPIGIPVAVPVSANECGGPAVGLDGQAMGLIIGRPALTFALVLPTEQVRERLKELRLGRPCTKLPPRALPAGAAPKLVSMALPDILESLKKRANRYAALLVEYDVTTEADADPRLLVAWQLNIGRDSRERHRIAFRGAKRLIEIRASKGFAFPVPAFEAPLDPAAPVEIAKSLQTARHMDLVSRKQGRIDHFFRYGSGATERWVFDEKNLSEAEGYEPTDYLANIGLQPPKATSDEGSVKHCWRLPGDFARLPRCQVLPREETADGVSCVVLQVPLDHGTETIWLDPGLGYSPRKWEFWSGKRLVWRRTNKDFREFAPGCWLPLEAAASFGPPAWTSLIPPDQSVYTQRMVLRFARVNDVPGSVFTR